MQPIPIECLSQSKRWCQNISVTKSTGNTFGVKYKRKSEYLMERTKF